MLAELHDTSDWFEMRDLYSLLTHLKWLEICVRHILNKPFRFVQILGSGNVCAFTETLTDACVHCGGRGNWRHRW